MAIHFGITLLHDSISIAYSYFFWFVNGMVGCYDVDDSWYDTNVKHGKDEEQPQMPKPPQNQQPKEAASTATTPVK